MNDIEQVLENLNYHENMYLKDNSMFSAGRQDAQIEDAHEAIMDLDSTMNASQVLGSISAICGLNPADISTQGIQLMTAIIGKLDDLQSDETIRSEIYPIKERLEAIVDENTNSYTDNSKGFKN